MKNLIKNGILALVAVLIAPQATEAQGTITYLSNLGQLSTGSLAVGSNSWLAAEFHTGNNASGYLLNSIQLGMTDASGNPRNFTAMIYTWVGFSGIFPGSSLGTLDGSLNPVSNGVYTYTDDSNITLSPNDFYFIVLTAGTAIANGAYEWSLDNTVPPFSIGWTQDNAFYQSSNGLSWIGNIGAFEYAINATAVPEPSSSFFLLLGSGVFIYVRRAFSR